MRIVDDLDSKIRYPTQSGRFYESTAESLRNQIDCCFLSEIGPGRIPEVPKDGSCELIGLVSPHAGYMFSGPVAAHSYFALASNCKPETVIILGPNHTGYGAAISLMNDGIWQTPLGNVKIDNEMANKIAKSSQIIDIEEMAHRFEHSIEVQLPFLQYLYGSDFRFVPICFQLQDINTALEIGKVLAQILLVKNAVVIASSDMTHYQPHKIATSKDLETLKAVEELDIKRFYSLLESRGVTACGYGPIATIIAIANELHGKETQLLCYKTSGDITRDYSSVVGYAAMSFKK